jgi:hypothetical protein
MDNLWAGKHYVTKNSEHILFISYYSYLINEVEFNIRSRIMKQKIRTKLLLVHFVQNAFRSGGSNIIVHRKVISSEDMN